MIFFLAFAAPKKLGRAGDILLGRWTRLRRSTTKWRGCPSTARQINSFLEDGWLYLAAELDLCSKRVLGWKACFLSRLRQRYCQKPPFSKLFRFRKRSKRSWRTESRPNSGRRGGLTISSPDLLRQAYNHDRRYPCHHRRRVLGASPRSRKSLRTSRAPRQRTPK